MSYILEALKRADAERERGTAPGLHAHPVSVDARHHPLTRATRPFLLVLAGVGLALLMLLWVGWRTSPLMSSGIPAVPQISPNPSITLPALTSPALTLPVVTSAPPNSNSPPPVPVSATAPAPAAVKAVTPSSTTPSLAELPSDNRLALPKLVISGSTYSSNPAYRMLIINGQVFHEGEPVATDLVLEEIGLNAAVISFKGQRYLKAY